MLAVAYTINGSSFIDVYSVQSFLSNVSDASHYAEHHRMIQFFSFLFVVQNVQYVKSKVHVSRDINVRVKQMIWNPVIANTLAICLEDGTLGMYVFNATNFDYFTLDRSNEVR